MLSKDSLIDPTSTKRGRWLDYFCGGGGFVTPAPRIERIVILDTNYSGISVYNDATAQQ
jgi:hypothetical protein